MSGYPHISTTLFSHALICYTNKKELIEAPHSRGMKMVPAKCRRKSQKRLIPAASAVACTSPRANSRAMSSKSSAIRAYMK